MKQRMKNEKNFVTFFHGIFTQQRSKFNFVQNTSHSLNHLISIKQTNKQKSTITKNALRF